MDENSIELSLLYRLTGEQYDAMIEHGILDKRDLVELLDGLPVVRKPYAPDYLGPKPKPWPEMSTIEQSEARSPERS